MQMSLIDSTCAFIRYPKNRCNIFARYLTTIFENPFYKENITMHITVNNVIFKNVHSTTDSKGRDYWHSYLQEAGSRDCICVNIDEAFKTLIPETPCDVVLNYRFSVVEKSGVKNYYHNFDVVEIKAR